MTKSSRIAIPIILLALIIGGGSYLYYQSSKQVPVVTPAPQTITYLVSTVDSTKYCNGADMDSEGYRKTITKELTTSTTETNSTTIQKVKTLINVATTGMCTQVLNQLPITEKNGIVTIPPVEGWAGVSIAMCSCKPQVEVNLLRLPGVTSVVWE